MTWLSFGRKPPPEKSGSGIDTPTLEELLKAEKISLKQFLERERHVIRIEVVESKSTLNRTLELIGNLTYATSGAVSLGIILWGLFGP